MSAPTYEAGGYKNLTATTQVTTTPATVLGVFVSSSSSGTFQVYDSASAATTTPVTGSVSAVAGTFYPLKASLGSGIYVVAGGTINATVIFA